MSATLAVRLPPKADPRWRLLASQGTTKPIKLLALKFMLSRMNQEIKRDASPACIDRNVDELHQFFASNSRMVETDAATLFA